MRECSDHTVWSLSSINTSHGLCIFWQECLLLLVLTAVCPVVLACYDYSIIEPATYCRAMRELVNIVQITF